MAKQKLEFYLGALEEITRIMKEVKEINDAAGGNPWGMWMDINLMMDEDTKMGKITYNEYGDLVFRPNIKLFEGDY